MYSDTELNGATGVLVAALQYRDMSERPDREVSSHSRSVGGATAKRPARLRRNHLQRKSLRWWSAKRWLRRSRWNRDCARNMSRSIVSRAGGVAGLLPDSKSSGRLLCAC